MVTPTTDGSESFIPSEVERHRAALTHFHKLFLIGAKSSRATLISAMPES